MQTNLKFFLPAIVYGGTDGAVTTFSVMAGAYGAGFDPSVIIILGLANLFSDGFSMASSDYLSEESRSTPVTRRSAFVSAITTFSAFIIIGSIPLIPFLYNFIFSKYLDNTFIISTVLTALAFIFIGVLRAYALNKSKLILAFQTLMIGSVSASIAYIIGEYLAGIIR